MKSVRYRSSIQFGNSYVMQWVMELKFVRGETGREEQEVERGSRGLGC